MAAGHVRMAHDERHPRVLRVHERPLLPQTVGTGHLAMVGGEHHHGAVGLATGLQRVQHRHQVAVGIADAVEVVVLVGLPGRFLVGHASEGHVAEIAVVAMRPRLARQVVAAAGRQRQAVGGGVQRVRRGRRQRSEVVAMTPRGLLRPPRGEVHDIVRVDEVHRQQPGLAGVARRGGLVMEPVRGLGGDLRVELVAGPGGAVGVAVEVEVGEPERLQRVARAGVAPVGELVVRAHLAEMPFALVGGAPAVGAEVVPQAGHGARDLGLREQPEVDVHAGALGVLAEVEVRARGRARRGVHVPLGEGGALRAQALMAGHSLQKHTTLC